MYAVIKSGGKQHRVTEGETLKLEKIEAATGDTIQFDEVLLVTDGDTITIGTPVVEGAAVTAEILSHGRGDKVRIIKFRRRKHSMTRQGHRQWYTEVKITDILASGAKKAPAKKKAAAPKAKAAAKAETGTDDLSKLTGVGPVLVKKLVEAGISSFAQIAAWSADDVATVDEKLNLKGRIERDDWIAQAKEFIK
ncbi:MAG: large subunit ribosomal protein L21 [Kiritimatiellia bacterium]|jgi:large subunit ribosomal protein L21